MKNQKRAEASVVIQSAVRGSLARRRSAELKVKVKRETSASVLQRRYRKYRAARGPLPDEEGNGIGGGEQQAAEETAGDNG